MATLMTTSGHGIVTSRLGGGGTTPNFVAWGTGAGTTAAGDTTLFTEVSPRVGATTSQVTTTVTNDTFQIVATQTAGVGETITNAGVFDAITSGNLFVKGDFAGLALNTGDSIQFTFKVVFN